MRLFVGIPISKFEFAHKELFKSKPIKWIPEENYHLTLCFLGSIAGEKVPLIIEAVESISSKFPPLELYLHGVGSFPKENNSNVLWIGLKENLSLRTLQQELQTKLKNLGLEIGERVFYPHLTIGRIKSPLNLELEIKQICNLPFQSFKANEIILYESKTGAPNPIYTEIRKFHLNSFAATYKTTNDSTNNSTRSGFST